MLYNIEFQVQQLERKVSFASGKRSLEETIALKEQINVLQVTYLLFTFINHDRSLIGW
jgi:hypothetical protein